MATDLTKLVEQLSSVSGDLTKAADGVSPADVSKEFGAALDGVISKLQSVSMSLGSGGAAFVHAFDELMSGSLAEFVKLSADIGGDVKTQCDALVETYNAQRVFLVTVSECKMPSTSVLQSLMKPMGDQIAATQQVRDDNRKNVAQSSHLAAVSEGVPAVGWVTVAKPANYVKDMVDAAQFYTNRVIKDYKEKDKMHVEWARKFIKVLKDLEAYVGSHHTNGIVWNTKGKDASAAAASAPPPPAAGGAPPPPPPGPPPPPAPVASTGGDPDKQAAAASQLFSEINKGADITSHLKKVTPDMQTHKNPTLRGGATVPPTVTKSRTGPKPFKAPSSVSSVSAPSKAAVAPKKEPKFGLEGKRWNVEFQEGNKDLVIEGNMKQTIYIYKCKDSTIQVKGKINSITMDGCKKTAVVFENVLGTVDFVNCQSVQAQVTGKVPIISIDKTDGIQVYLSDASVACEIVSAKSSEMNVSIPKDDGDYSEYALPEQYKSQWNGKKFVTDCTESL